MDHFTLFSGTANQPLAEAIANAMGVPLGSATVERFPDGELSVWLEQPVRGHEVFLVQPTCPPVNEHLVELLLFVDACRRAAARHVTAIIPYFGYARSDKRHGHREPIAASMVVDLLEAVQVDHVVVVDLHAPQIEGFFKIPVDSLTAVPALAQALRGLVPRDALVVAPDAGRVKMASRYAQELDSSVIVLHKERESGTRTRVTHLVGEVKGRACILVDDMISTAGTVAESVEVLLAAGARPAITVAATHGLLLEGARERLAHEAIQAVLVTDTIAKTGLEWPKQQVISVAPLIAGAVHRFLMDGSLSELF